MPNKSRRIASRQAGLSGRAKRERPHGPPGIPKTPPPSRESGGGYGRARLDGSAAQPSEAQGTTPPAVARAPGATPQRQRGRGVQRKPLESYFLSELRRIALTTGAILLILAVLAFVLR